ncbi:MAG: hypothetical protein ABIP71_13140 [Verrucomicrobiota bacterium]
MANIAQCNHTKAKNIARARRRLSLNGNHASRQSHDAGSQRHGHADFNEGQAVPERLIEHERNTGRKLIKVTSACKITSGDAHVHSKEVSV